MGIGGHFWDLLKPYARYEGFDCLRNKRVAVDLSYWIVQNETAVRAYVRNPHLRLTFFRTVNLFSKFGAYPVFVVDGTPSPLKSRARILRFCQAAGIELPNLSLTEEGVSTERNRTFLKCVQECEELLEHLGMPVLKASGEAEALCAQLNREGLVDACITADSDAFLYGAECVVKRLCPNSKEPFECYYISDIEAGLGLKRNHLITISLLVGNDHDLNGVQGIGLDTALRFVKSFSDNEILNRLQEIGKGNVPPFQGGLNAVGDIIPTSDKPVKTNSHCSRCGHPGSKRAHLKFPCEFCCSVTSEGCMQKSPGFKCDCTSCDLDRTKKEWKKNEIWQIKVCKRIAMEQGFPNDDIINMYLGKNQGSFHDETRLTISWGSLKTNMLVDFLSYHQHWEPSYIRQRIFPMLSTIFLREMALNPSEVLLHGQYEFDSIQRVKTRLGHKLFVVNWRKAAKAMSNTINTATSEELDAHQSSEPNDSTDLFDEPDVPQIVVADGCWFLSTDENMELVEAAFPEKVQRFTQETELKQTKSRKRGSLVTSSGTPVNSESSQTSRSMQLSLTEFYRSSKTLGKVKKEESSSENSGNRNFSKSARRRLLFD